MVEVGQIKAADLAECARPPEEVAQLGQLAAELAAASEPAGDAIADRTPALPHHPEINYVAPGDESKESPVQAALGDRRLCAEDMPVLAEQFGYKLYCHVHSLVHDPHVAEDLTQDTLLKAFRGIGNADITTRTAPAWLYRIATNTTYDHLRALQVRMRVSPYSIDQLTSTENGDGIKTESGRLQLAAPSVDIESDLDHRHIVDAMFGELAREYPGLKYELVLRLQYYEELTVAEIAQVLGVEYHAMKQHVYRARRAAGRILAKLGITTIG